jgi:hypothetical protein
MKKRLEEMSRVSAEVIKNTRSVVVRRQFYFIAYNVSQIAEGGEIEVLNLNIKRMLNRSTTVDISTKPPLLAMCCYKPFFFTN